MLTPWYAIVKAERWEHRQTEVAHWLVVLSIGIYIMTRSNEINTRIESAAGSINSTGDVHDLVIYHRPTMKRKKYTVRALIAKFRSNFSPLSLFPIRYKQLQIMHIADIVLLLPGYWGIFNLWRM